MKTHAVSEVIGTLLLVGVVITGITLVGIVLFANTPASKVPVLDTIISNKSNTIYIYHKGGDALWRGEYQILVNGIDRTALFVSDGSEPWSVGKTLNYTSPIMPYKVVIFFNKSGGGGTILATSNLRPPLIVPGIGLPTPPSMAWSNSPAFGNATTSFQFTDSSTGPNVNAWFWNFNDPPTSTQQNPTHTFATPANPYTQYSINHSATDSAGEFWAATSWLNRSSWVTVFWNSTPTANFTQNIVTGNVPFSVQFTSIQAGAIKPDSWFWDFGDSGTSTLQNPSYMYTVGGRNYTVSLTVTNYTLGVSPTYSKTNLIVAKNPAPVVAWSVSPRFGNGTTPSADVTSFTFTDTSTCTNCTDPQAYYWNFNDGNTTNTKSPVKIFPHNTEYITYSINHSVTDSFGTLWALTTWLNRSSWVTVFKNHTPTTGFTQDVTSGTVSFPVQFTATQAGAIRNDSWSWNFGDTGTSNSYNPPHTYTVPGRYDVSLTSTNYTLGVSPTYTKAGLILAKNPAPTVVWSNSPPFGNYTTPIQFTDTSTCTNCTNPQAYYWNFNDGNTTNTKSPANTFPHNGEYIKYNINHSVTDSFGTPWMVPSWLNRSSWVTVFKNRTPTANFTQNVVAGIIPFSVQFTSVRAGAIWNNRWDWDFGDAGTSTLQNPSHSYVTAGTRSVSLTATNYTLGVSPTYTKTNLIRAYPPPAYVQSNSSNSLPFSNNETIWLNGASTAGNLIVVSIDIPSVRSVSSVTDNLGNTYTQAIMTGPSGNYNREAYTYYYYNINAGVNRVKFNFDAALIGNASIAEYSGIRTDANPLDNTRGANGRGTAIATANRTPSLNWELIYGYAVSGRNPTDGATFTTRQNPTGHFTADKVVSTQYSYNVDGTNDVSGYWICQMVLFEGWL